MLEMETKWPDPKDGAGSDVSEEGTASTVQTHQSSSIVTLPPSKDEEAAIGSPSELTADGNGNADTDAPHRAIPLGTLDSFNGLSKNRVFEWHIKEYTVTRNKEPQTILQGIAGRAQNGTFSAIMGPSGCGKTSLLDCLALRNQTFTGALRLDGLPLTGSFFLNTGYVHQKELFFQHLTVREHLLFHAINRMSRIRTHAQCQERVEKVMEEVDLVKVADSTIGGGEFYTLKGLSGGERKRLNIATELLADPSVLLLDEPTSGLDSVMGEIICLLLRNIAVRKPKRIVITAIHTPSSRVFMLFTHVTLLTSKGELAYWGRREDLLPYLEGLGYACPPLFNPADFVLELASAKVIRGQAGSSNAPDQPAFALLERFSSSQAGSSGSGSSSGGKSMSIGAMLVASESAPKLVGACKQRLSKELERLEPDNCHKQVMGVRGSKSSFWVSYRMNLWRSWLTQTRDSLGIAVGVVMNAILGLVFGVLYFNQIPHDTGRNTIGFLFSLLVTLMISSSIAVCLYFPLDYQILMREYYVGANTAPTYFLGRTMSSFPNSTMFLLNGIIPYFMTGLAPTAEAFGKFLLVMVLMNHSAQSMGYLASSFSANPIVGMSILPLFITPMILFSGMLYERNSVPAGLEWLQDISLVNYGYALMVINQAQNAGEQVSKFLLGFLQVEPSQWTKFLVLLACLSFVYRFLAMVVLTIRVRYISKAT